MKAIFKTKSNYRNLNGVQLEIVEIAETRITALVPDEILGQIKVDFSLKELVKFTTGYNSNKQ